MGKNTVDPAEQKSISVLSFHNHDQSRIKLFLAGFAMAFLASGSAISLGSQEKSKSNIKVPEQSYVLRIRHKDMGVISAHLSKCGFLLVSPLANLLSTPPKYDTVIYNPENKKYIRFAVDEMNKRIKLMTRENEIFGRDQDSGPYAKRESTQWHVVSKETLLGLNTIVYRRITNQDNRNHTNTTEIDDVWVCRDPRFMGHASQFVRTISYLWHTPEVDFGLPLKRELTMAITDKKGNILRQDKPTVEYVLLSVKEEKIDAERFKVPAGFTKSADEIGVIGLSSLGGQKLFQ